LAEGDGCAAAHCPFALCRRCDHRHSLGVLDFNHTDAEPTAPGFMYPACSCCPRRCLRRCPAHLSVNYMLCAVCGEARCPEHVAVEPELRFCPLCTLPEAPYKGYAECFTHACSLGGGPRQFLYCARCGGIACSHCCCAATGYVGSCTKCGHDTWSMKFALHDVVRVAEGGADESDTDSSSDEEEEGA
jgi:hypothetical protein